MMRRMRASSMIQFSFEFHNKKMVAVVALSLLLFQAVFDSSEGIPCFPTANGWTTFVEVHSPRVPTTKSGHSRRRHRRGHHFCLKNEKTSRNVSPLGMKAIEHSEQEPRRLRLNLSDGSGGKKTEARLRSRSLAILSDWTITVWEWEQPAEVVESYWEEEEEESQAHPTRINGADGLQGLTRTSRRVLDPFGLVTWPGSVVAARALKRESAVTVHGQSVLILGAGVGVEAQAAAELGAKTILATDIHPTTLQQLELGIKKNDRIQDKDVVQTEIFDIMGDDPLPMPSADLIIVADVLYNEQLATQVARRLVEGWRRNPQVKILVTDSQRFVDFRAELNRQFSQQTMITPDFPAAAATTTPNIDFTEDTLAAFTGSGVCINDDQTYDVKVREIWIGLTKP